MICKSCRDAADARAPRDQHCADPKCPCGHRVERYRARPYPPVARPDDPPCTATWTQRHGGTQHCHLTAGHYDGADQPDPYASPPHPGGWHTNESCTWADFAEDTTPHITVTED